VRSRETIPRRHFAHLDKLAHAGATARVPSIEPSSTTMISNDFISRDNSAMVSNRGREIAARIE
jgi:hypothetical protein